MEKKGKQKNTLKLKKLLPIDQVSDSESFDEEEDLVNFNITQKDLREKQKQTKKEQQLPKKRKREASEESKNGKSSKSINNDSDFDQINVDFELVQPCEPYFHSVKNLLNQYLDGEDQVQLDVSGLSDIVVSTISIGSIIASSLDKDPADMPEYKDLNEEEFNKIALKYNADREIYGFATILSLTRRQKQNKCFQQILNYVKKKAEENCNQSQIQLFEQAFKKKNVGILLNERFINLPLDIVPSLHQSLPDDLKFTKKQDDIEDPREFDYDYLLVISRFTIENYKKVKGQEQKKQKTQERLYYKYEDEIFSKNAEVQFSFKTTFKEILPDGSKAYLVGGRGGPETHYKLIYLIKYSEYEKRVKEL